MVVNRNKRGIGLDLKQQTGSDILRRLVIDADVVIENYRSDTMPGFGLGYGICAMINPG